MKMHSRRRGWLAANIVSRRLKADTQFINECLKLKEIVVKNNFTHEQVETAFKKSMKDTSVENNTLEHHSNKNMAAFLNSPHVEDLIADYIYNLLIPII